MKLKLHFFLCLILVVLSGSGILAGAGFETPPTFPPEKVLPADLVKGPFHQVANPVLNDGYLNKYKISTRFGDFEARGTFLLRIRIPEIAALEELDKVSKTKVFLESAKDSALGPVNSVVGFAQKPVETAKEIPGGVGRMFKKVGRSVKKGVDSVSDDEEEEKDQSDKESTSTKLVKYYFGINDAERKWSQKVGVDPYTSNTVLSKAIHDMAIVDRAGSFTVKLAPIPSIPGLGTMSTVYEIAWSKDPYELKEINQKRLKEMGVPPEVIEKFFQNGFLTPTQQTVLISTLMQLPEVKQRPLVIEQSLDVESEVQAFFFIENFSYLSWYHAKKGKLKQFVAETRLPAAETMDGTTLLLLAADYLSWTKEIQEAAARLNAAYPAAKAPKRELWIRGGASESFRAEMSKLGWKLQVGFQPQK